MEPLVGSRGMADVTPPPETVLFVEDEVLVRMDMAEYLRESGYRVHEAHAAPAAIDVLNSKMAIDLVISDIQMDGEMDGIGLVEWILAHRPGVAVLLCSAFERSAKVPDNVAYLTKPYTGRALLDAVQAAIRKEASGGAVD